MLLLGLMLLSALTEVVSLGAVLPFLGVLLSPERIFLHSSLTPLVTYLGITTAAGLLLPLTLFFAMAAIFASAMRLLVLWISTRLAFAAGADLSMEVYKRTLYQPYRVHISRNSSEVISGISNKVGIAINVVYQLLIFISSSMLMLAIVCALIAINPLVAILTAAGFGISYATFAFLSRHLLRRNSQRIAVEQTNLYKALQEGLGGIRDVLLDGTQSVYCDVYRRADQPFRRAQADNSFITGSPRYAMEALGMVLIAALTYGLSLQSGGLQAALPVLGALALAAQRLLPSLQQIYGAWAIIAGSQASIRDTIELLEQPLPAEAHAPLPRPLDLRQSISLQSVSFRYADEGPWILKDLNLSIPKGARVGFVGRTGSGKSTVLDLLMGLLTPTEGALVVDGRELSGIQLRAWQRSIAHVPQSIYLTDATMAENIAFGVPRDQIDMACLKRAAGQAQISEFIEGRPRSYDELVGERGVKLSGGQRQRIGIARALYKQSSVLIFDEATSALDNTTEQSVMAAIETLDRELTILLIAHRLSTVKRCDMLVELDSGRIVATGTYEELLERSPTFRAMAQMDA